MSIEKMIEAGMQAFKKNIEAFCGAGAEPALCADAAQAVACGLQHVLASVGAANQKGSNLMAENPSAIRWRARSTYTSGPGSTLPPQIKIGDRITLETIEELHIRRVLASTSSVQESAEVLGIDKATLWRKRKQFGL